MSPPATRFVVVGAGLGGSLMAALLGRAGMAVEVLERRSDPREGPVEAGRSINLAISARGLNALGKLGIAEEVLGMAVPLYGRMIHAHDGHLAYQAYGKGSQAINSVSRAALNLALVNVAAQSGTVGFEFDRRCLDVDLATGTVTTVDAHTGADLRHHRGVVIGADGAFSAVRTAMQKTDRQDYAQEYLEHGYKELHIPAGPDGGHVLEPNALHIWPRGGFMMMAMANQDGSFTVTLYLPADGPNGFRTIRTPDDVRAFFEREFPDAVPLMPTLVEDYLAHPTGSLLTIRTRPWHVDDRVVLLGDAAHAIVPFYGQGANAAFEDCLELLAAIQGSPNDLASAFARFETARKVNADAIAELAVTNFHEMKDHVASPMFLFKKRLEKLLYRLFPGWFMPLYPMISFSLIPYAQAKRRAAAQERALKLVALGLGAIVVGALLFAILF